MEFERLLRIPELKAQFGKGRSAIYQDIKDGTCPPLIPVSTRKNGSAAAAALPASEAQALIRARIAGKSDDELRALVRDLIAKRQLQAA